MITLNGKDYHVCDEGYLLNFDDYDDDWRDGVAQALGIRVEEDHQHMIDKVQAYYEKEGFSPDIRQISQKVGIPLKRLYEIFPSRAAFNLCKISGLPKPVCRAQ